MANNEITLVSYTWLALSEAFTNPRASDYHPLFFLSTNTYLILYLQLVLYTYISTAQPFDFSYEEILSVRPNLVSQTYGTHWPLHICITFCKPYPYLTILDLRTGDKVQRIIGIIMITVDNSIYKLNELSFYKNELNTLNCIRSKLYLLSLCMHICILF